jgi:hypothetical protein
MGEAEFLIGEKFNGITNKVDIDKTIRIVQIAVLFNLILLIKNKNAG